MHNFNRQNRFNNHMDPNLVSTESIILDAIRNYFALLWAHHYSPGDDNRYAVRVLAIIKTAIQHGDIPPSYNFIHYCPAVIFVTNRPIPRTVIEAYFAAISDYLVNKMTKPDEVRQREYEELVENERSRVSRARPQ